MRPGKIPAAEISFRFPAKVIHIRCYQSQFGLSVYPVCPRCSLSMDREYQAYCDRCGQCLDWKDFHKTIMILNEK